MSRTCIRRWRALPGPPNSTIPRDRLVDGVDQSAAILLFRQTNPRRRRDQCDRLFNQPSPEGDCERPVETESFTGSDRKRNFAADFYNLYRDTREEYPISTEVGAWGGAGVRAHPWPSHGAEREIPRHHAPAYGVPYEGIENLRPETLQAVEAFMIKRASPQQ